MFPSANSSIASCSTIISALNLDPSVIYRGCGEPAKEAGGSLKTTREGVRLASWCGPAWDWRGRQGLSQGTRRRRVCPEPSGLRGEPRVSTHTPF